MPAQAAMVWVEDGSGTITRGNVESASARGAAVRLSAKPRFHVGDEVAVRICVAIGSPTVATTARVGRVQDSGEVAVCDLEWIGTEDGALERSSSPAA